MVKTGHLPDPFAPLQGASPAYSVLSPPVWLGAPPQCILSPERARMTMPRRSAAWDTSASVANIEKVNSHLSKTRQIIEFNGRCNCKARGKAGLRHGWIHREQHSRDPSFVSVLWALVSSPIISPPHSPQVTARDSQVYNLLTGPGRGKVN